MNRLDALRAALERALGRPVDDLRLQPLGGGCINDASVASTGDVQLFVKWNEHPLPRQFEVEAAGLRALREAGSRLRVPAPIALSDEPGRSYLVVEYLPPGRPAAGFDEELGRGLAEVHRHSSPAGFGFSLDGYCGTTPQPNGWLPRWLDFYRERRLLHQLTLARGRGLPAAAVAAVERVCARLGEWIDDDEPPALVHGDLWSGNLHVTLDGRPGLIDPAAYYGHREAELGMMTLFGGFSSRVYAAYDEAWPLRAGWEERADLYALYHLLNHFNLFGGAYGAQAERLARRYA